MSEMNQISWGWDPVWVARIRRRPSSRRPVVDDILISRVRDFADFLDPGSEIMDLRSVAPRKTGPTTIYWLERQQLSSSGIGIGDLIDWPGVSRSEDAGSAELDVSTSGYMGAIPFWRLIDCLEGEISHTSLRRLERELDRLPSRLIQAFAETMSRELFSLDSPRNARYINDEPKLGIDDEKSLAARITVLSWGGDWLARVFLGMGEAPVAPDIGALALIDTVRQKIEKLPGGTWPPIHPLETGTNAVEWGFGGGRMVQLDDWPPSLTPEDAGPFSADADMFDGGGKTLWSFRWLVERSDKRFEERVGVVLEASERRAGRRALRYIRDESAADGDRQVLLIGELGYRGSQRPENGDLVAQLVVEHSLNEESDFEAASLNQAQSALAIDSHALAEPRDATMTIAMEAVDFWALIAVLGGECTENSIDVLTQRLSTEPVERIVAFEAALTLALFDLDTRAAFEWYEAHDPNTALGVSDDVFLYARCATVASGREVWERAVAEGTLEAIGNAESAEDLLFVASNAAGVDTDEWHPDVIPLSYETGENEAGWAAGEDSSATM